MSRLDGFKVENYPPPSYHSQDRARRESEDEDRQDQSCSNELNANEASQAQARAWRRDSPAPFVSSSFSSVPSHPTPLRPAPYRPASRSIPLQPVRVANPHGSHQLNEAGANSPHGTPPKDPFADPEDLISNAESNPPGWWAEKWEKHRNLFGILLANIPFLIMFTMDIVGTYIIPTSSFYRSVIRSQAFVIIYVSLGGGTAVLNLMWFCNNRLGYAGQGAYYDEYTPQPPARGSWAHVRRYIIFFFAVICVCCWPMIEVWGVQKNIKPTYPSCKQRGFKSSVLLQVVAGQTNRFNKQWASNNATITSDDESFGLRLSPTIRPVSSRDVFYFLPSVALTTPSLFPRVKDNEVVMRLADKTYKFEYTVPKVPNTPLVRNGTFSDDPDYYLSFPDLSPPMHSTTKGNWTYVNTRPWVELVDDERTVLKTVENHGGDDVNTMMRMCGAWSLDEMMEDEQRMETVLVGLARMMIEFAKWGLDY